MSVKALNETTFESEVAQGVTLVDFWAEWCMPCKAMLPILDTVAEHTADMGDVTVAKVNVDESPALAGKYGISSIPSLLLFKDGKLVDQKAGMQSARALLDGIENSKTA